MVSNAIYSFIVVSSQFAPEGPVQDRREHGVEFGENSLSVGLLLVEFGFKDEGGRGGAVPPWLCPAGTGHG